MKTSKHFSLLVAAGLLLSTTALPGQPRGGPPTPVIVAIVEKQPVVDEVEALGTLRANESVDLTAIVTERVTLVNFEDGERIKQGHLLVEMDAAEELAALAEERSRVNEAKRQLERLRPLAERGAASEAVLDEWHREVETGEARLQAIQSRIAQRRIAAPFDGVVGLRQISVGALVQPGTLITTIDDDRIMKLDFPVPSVFLSTLEPGVAIEATARAFPGEIFTGTISSIDSRVDPVTRSVLARALIDNTDRRLKPGLLLQVTLQKNPRRVIMIPEEALIPNGADNFVLVLEEGEINTVARRKVTLGARHRSAVEILGGLQEGEKVVTHGTLRARPGAPVEVTAVARGDEPLTELLNSDNSKKGKG